MENKSGVVSYTGWGGGGWRCKKKRGKMRKKDIKCTEIGVCEICAEVQFCD